MQYIPSPWEGPWLLGNHLLLDELTVSRITWDNPGREEPVPVTVPAKSDGRVEVQLSLVLKQNGISSLQAHGHYLHVRVVVQQLMLLCGEVWIGAAEISTSALLRA